MEIPLIRYIATVSHAAMVGVPYTSKARGLKAAHHNK